MLELVVGGEWSKIVVAVVRGEWWLVETVVFGGVGGDGGGRRWMVDSVGDIGHRCWQWLVVMVSVVRGVWLMVFAVV